MEPRLTMHEMLEIYETGSLNGIPATAEQLQKVETRKTIMEFLTRKSVDSQQDRLYK